MKGWIGDRANTKQETKRDKLEERIIRMKKHKLAPPTQQTAVPERADEPLQMMGSRGEREGVLLSKERRQETCWELLKSRPIRKVANSPN